MIYAGIDVAKDEHVCLIADSDGVVPAGPFAVQNNRAGFDALFQTLTDCSEDLSMIKAGLEATGHFSCRC